MLSLAILLIVRRTSYFYPIIVGEKHVFRQSRALAEGIFLYGLINCLAQHLFPRLHNKFHFLGQNKIDDIKLIMGKNEKWLLFLRTDLFVGFLASYVRSFFYILRYFCFHRKPYFSRPKIFPLPLFCCPFCFSEKYWNGYYVNII